MHVIGEQHCPLQTLKAYIDLIKQPSVLGASSTWSDDDVASLGNLIGLLLVAFFRLSIETKLCCFFLFVVG